MDFISERKIKYLYQKTAKKATLRIIQQVLGLLEGNIWGNNGF